MDKQNQIPVDLSQTQGMNCDNCGNEVFVPGFMFRTISRFITGGAQDGLIPVEVFFCSKCQHVNDAFLPVALKSKQPPVEKPLMKIVKD